MNAVVGTRPSSFLDQITSQPLNSPLQNDLLAALPGTVKQSLFPRLELCGLPQGTVLAKPGMATDYFYFPIDCLVSRHCINDDEAGTAMAVIGNDGVIGVDLFIESGSAPTVSVVQIAGHAFRIERQLMLNELERHAELMAVLCRHSDELLTQMAQTAVCNRRHTLVQQLCRWLLLSLDRLPADNFRMTQQQISHALGVDVEYVNAVARKLQSEGVLKCVRGHITLLDRPKLEALSCDCYEAVTRDTGPLWTSIAPLIDFEPCDANARQ